MENLTISITASSENPTKTVIKTPSFSFIVDEPVELGGTDHGPSPLEYLSGALAGCFSVVGHMLAKEMDIAIRGIKFNIDGELNPAKLSGATTEGRAGYHILRVQVLPDCDADKETLASWLKAVRERCPLTDNIVNATPVEFTLG